MNELHIGDRVKVTGTVVGIDKSDIVWPYRIDFGDIPRCLNKDVIIELVPPAVPPGWFPADVPPKDSEKSEANRDIEIMLKDGFTGKGWYGPKGHNWRIYFYPKDIVDDDILCWRELEPPAKSYPDGWRSAINDPPSTSCDVRLWPRDRDISIGRYYRTGNTWYENGHHVVDILAWKDIEPPAPARRFKRGDKVKNETCHYTATFVKYTDDEICNCAVKRDDMLNDNDSTDLWYAEESNLELIPPAPAKPEYHKNQRVWLHVCGEVFPATFRKYTNNAITSSGGRCCVVERDDKLDGGSKHHHWLMGEEYLEPMPDAEDPRKEHL
jgi:hypothetical protein